MSSGYLAVILVFVTAFVFGLNWVFHQTPSHQMFNLQNDVGFGHSTWTYHVGIYVAPWNRFQPYLVIDIEPAD